MTVEDVPGLVALMREMQAHYGVPCPPDAAIARDLADLPPGTTILVARPADGPEGRPLLGFAALNAVYPGPSLRRGLFLKELYVAAEVRGAGIGRELLAEAARFARAGGYARLDWTADRSDPGLLGFYRRTGALEHPEKAFFRLAGEALAALAGDS